MTKKHLFIFLVLVPLLACSAVAVQIYYSIAVWKYDGPEKTFVIKPGEGFSKINHHLATEDIISSSKLFYRYNKIYNRLNSFKAGNYIIKPGINMLGVIDLLTTGKGQTISVTIPEGKNLFQIADILESDKITNKEDFIKLSKNPDFVSTLGIPASRVEGYLYPETYHFAKNTPASTVIRTMVNTFNDKTSAVDFSKSKLSKHSVIILASVVEKETGASFERPQIAGVFTNRLKKKMRLQSDPTTIYGIWENYNGNLRKKHLLERTEYNTYKIPALPIGPISNPGIESIKAVLNPEKHNYLYFVSKNDGTHIFSETYKQHRNAVYEFQKNSKNRQGKSWRDLKQK
ncbi:endolytic transglycosylase MltG [Halobacteriovorax sp. JY17]|uniref:endolytic transglycosylase MltG n=1 Tax=Halobacteriovorax sp. JY17 TaxID=2014617 RepID=UPI000C3E8518|nr:endolytic transglycosylase MltG [Halobacteriovorax sp. JY17]PIK14968.1 MAG: aminodeoxychorismate lyase [Halobacteriovorax sp. JY17]